MTASPILLLDLVDRLRSDDSSSFSIHEDHISCTIECHITVERQAECLALSEAPPAYVDRITLRDSFDERVNSVGITALDNAKIEVWLKTVDGCRPFFSTQGFCDFQLVHGLAGLDRILINEVFPEFAVGTTWVSPWRAEHDGGSRLDSSVVEDLRPLVVEAGTELLPARMNDWILTHAPKSQSATFDKYCRAAWPKICAFFFSRVTGKAESAEGRWKGDKARAFRLQPGVVPITADDLLSVSEAVRWIAQTEVGMDMRHAFLTGEIAATHSRPCELVEFLRSHLPSARERAAEAYRHYANGLTEKVVRAVAELRKALMEDVGRQVTFSKDLSSQLWKDSALGVAALAAKYLIEPSRTDREIPFLFGASIGTVALIGVLGLMWAHFALTLFGNHKFHHSIADSRDKWRGHLHGALGVEEYADLYEAPLQKARRTYHIQCGLIAVLYGIITAVGVAIVKSPAVPSAVVVVPRSGPAVDSSAQPKSSKGSEAARTDTGRGTRSAGRPGG